MLTPTFTVQQTADHVVLEVRLASIHCRLADAQFDISGQRFTLYCRPYYLRLQFDQNLAEGRDEKATYDLETNYLKILLPKETIGEEFTHLHDPAYLIATAKQRAAQRRGPLIQVMSSTVASRNGNDSDGADDSDDGDEMEFVQQLSHNAEDNIVDVSIGGNEEKTLVSHNGNAPQYGFSHEYSNAFRNLDAETVHDAVDLRDPDSTTLADRRAARIASEQAAFHEDALWYSLADEEGEVEHLLLHFTPYYVTAFEEALHKDGVVVLHRQETGAPTTSSTSAAAGLPYHAAEEEHSGALDGHQRHDGSNPHQRNSITLWQGNIASFSVEDGKTSDLFGFEASPASPESVGSWGEDNVGSSESVACNDATNLIVSSGRVKIRLAMPKTIPVATMTHDESDMLTRIKPSMSSLTGRSGSLLLPPHEPLVQSLTVELLLVYVYDHITTMGTSSSESSWTVCKLSPSLSWLDTLPTVYDACVAFTRRSLIYPLHRHLDLVRRCFRDAGILCLLGPSYLVKALLAIKYMLDHSEHKLVLSTIFLNPLILHWQRLDRATATARLRASALELHEVATRQQPSKVRVAAHEHRQVSNGDEETSTSEGSINAILRMSATLTTEVVRHPITVLFLGLPIAME